MTFFIGVDLHKTQFTVHVRTEDKIETLDEIKQYPTTFLSKDMLPESYLCGKETENIRRLLKSRERLVRSIVGQKNEVHALLVSLGISDDI